MKKPNMRKQRKWAVLLAGSAVALILAGACTIEDPCGPGLEMRENGFCYPPAPVTTCEPVPVVLSSAGGEGGAGGLGGGASVTVMQLPNIGTPCAGDGDPVCEGGTICAPDPLNYCTVIDCVGANATTCSGCGSSCFTAAPEVQEIGGICFK